VRMEIGVWGGGRFCKSVTGQGVNWWGLDKSVKGKELGKTGV